MTDRSDTNAAIWKSDAAAADWAARVEERERKFLAHWRILGELLPFDANDAFTFLDLGAGSGSASRAILDLYPNSRAVLGEFSPQMIREGTTELQAYAGRFRYVEFDMLAGVWPDAIAYELDAAITSLSIHHMPDDRKQGLFAEIYDHLARGAWYLNYDPVTSTDPIVEAAWQRVNDRHDPDAEHNRTHRTPEQQARYENHARYIIPLDQQLAYFKAAGFEGVDVYWKHMENVIYGGRRPS
jgi:tRNA (cmo5U34)-methyltransferase